MVDYGFVQTVYDNTVFAAYKTASPLETEIVCHELATILDLRTDEDAVPTDDMESALYVIWKLNVDYTHLHFINKKVTDIDVRYKVGFADSRKTFEVRIAPDAKYPEHQYGIVMLNVLKEDKRK